MASRADRAAAERAGVATDEAAGETGDVPELAEIGLERFAPYLINRIAARWNADLAEDLRAAGLTTPKMRALAILSVMPGLTVGDLAVYAVMEQPTMSRTLDQLEAQGMIRRQVGADDGRVREVHLTEAGAEAFASFWPRMRERERALFAGVGAAEEEAFKRTLQTMLRNIRRNPI